MPDLEYRRLGRTEMKPKALGLGGGYLGDPAGSDEEAIRTIRGAIELGTNFIDTSPYYGVSEYRVGLALSEGWRDKVYLQTKVGSHPKFLRDFSKEIIKNSKVVLLHSSTALSFAVLFNKPTIFLTSDQLSKSWVGININTFAKSVNGPLINIDNNLDKELSSERLLTIDTNKYKSYLDHYLKFPNTKDVLLWEIITDYIRKNDSRKEF